MSKYQRGNFKAAMAYNEQKKCMADGCYERRWRISGYCEKHTVKNVAWGHPYGRVLKNEVLAMPTFQVQKVIIKNLDSHKGIAAGIAFFDNWMKTAYETYVPYRYRVDRKKDVVPAARLMSKLYEDGVTGLDCLVAVAGVWLLYAQEENRARKHIKSHQHCKFCLGQACFATGTIRKGERERSGPERKRAGNFIIDNIGPLLVTVAGAVQKMEQNEKEKLLAMTQELELEGIE